MSPHRLAEPITEEVSVSLKKFDDFTRTLLSNRGIKTDEEAEIFLNPDYERDLHDPFLILNMEKAVDRIIKAVQLGEKIVIYGDYDCDGIPGSVLLHDFFKKVGYQNFSNYIPHRHKEGYGLNAKAVDKFAKDGVNLLITVDVAITNVVEVSRAQSSGIDVIVTDHHLPGEEIPPAFAVLDSKQKNDTYPDKMLSGAGVAFKLVQALIKKNGKEWGIPEGWEKWLLDMAGLSTIADMVPLRGENRVIARYGLVVMRKSSRPGFQKLLRKMRVDQRSLTEDDVSFMIAPRINAASRMDIPMEAFRLLSTSDDKIADELSDHLHHLNDSRKELVAQMSSEIKRTMEKREVGEIIVIGNPNWRPGLLGILATNLVEYYDCPVFVWGKGEEPEIKGSCRSNGTVNVVELMSSVRKDFFLNVGGHEFSGGFSVSYDNIHFLEEEILKAHKKVKKAKTIPFGEMIDCALTIDDVNNSRYQKIEKLSPFGLENPKPVFIFSGAEVFRIEKFGKNKNHLKIIFKNSLGKEIPAIGFFMETGSFRRKPEEGEKIDLIASMEKDFFRGNGSIRLRIVDII